MATNMEVDKKTSGDGLARVTTVSKGHVGLLNETVANPGLERKLSQRHLLMLAIGGVIGPGYFVGMGTGLSTSGPAGLLVCFIVVGFLLWCVMQSLGELGAFIPKAGSFTHYTARFVDPALGFALGWNYWFLWAGIIIAEYNNLGLVLSFWETAMPRWGWIMVFWCIFLAFTMLGVQAFGEAEFWLALFKVVAILAFFLCAILISTGVLGGEKIGFKFYSDPGAFADGIRGMFKIFVFAGLQYSGTESIGLTAGESANPRRDVPAAVKSVAWRIIGIFILGIFFLTITVPYTDPNLLSASSKTARSPFVIAFTRVGIPAGAHAVNAIILVTMLSAINGALYEGQAPQVFAYTTKRGVPIVALVVCNAIGFLSLLSLSSSAGKVYTWIVSMTGVATFISWGFISLCHIRLRLALDYQNIPASVLPWQAPVWRFSAYFGFGLNTVFVFFQGWTSFAPWDVESFLMNYIMVAIFVALAGVWKLWHKTTAVNLKSVDLSGAVFYHEQQELSQVAAVAQAG